MLRDCAERGRNIENVLYQYNRFVKTAYDEFIRPTMKYSNLIVPFGGDNTTAIEFIIQNLQLRVERYKKEVRLLTQKEEE